MTKASDSRVVLEGYIVVPDSDLSQILKELPNHIKLTKEEEGCLLFSVLQRSSEPNVFDVFEEFADKNAFDRHQERARQSTWSEVTSNVERYYTVRGIT